MRFLLKLLGFPAPEYEKVAEVVKPVEPNPPKSMDVEEVCDYIRAKHMLDGLAVFLDGDLLCATYDPEDAEREFMILEYISEELGGVDVSHLRTEYGWLSLYREGKYAFVIRCLSHPSIAELRGIARDFLRMVR